MNNLKVPKTNDVIIIDDDPEVLDVLEMYCEGLDLFRNIVKARDGSEASKKLINQNFALILLDINMPKKSGVDILNEFSRGDCNEIETIMIVSGEINEKIFQGAIKKGVKNFLVKPFDENTFGEKVRDLLAKFRPDVLS